MSEKVDIELQDTFGVSRNESQNLDNESEQRHRRGDLEANQR